MGKGDFSKKIICWYLENHRELPWRKTKDPYRIWLSEVILQQTRVAQGLPYYRKFVRDFPNVKALAAAPQQKVLRTWQGLGYYTRARNLHACAKQIVTDYGGKFPRTYEELIKLPGIGSYTAAAIASMAFDQSVAVVDGNVYRILARIFGLQEDISTGEGKKQFAAKAQELIDKSQPGTFNQAIMEFGALYCTPRNPDCDVCIFSDSCSAKKHELQEMLPVKTAKAKVRTRYFHYFIFRIGNKVALKKRNGNDIWNGLYDFHLAEGKKSLKQLLREDSVLSKLQKRGNLTFESKPMKHILTHQIIIARFRILNLSNDVQTVNTIKNLGFKVCSDHQVHDLPKPVLISRFLDGNAILD